MKRDSSLRRFTHPGQGEPKPVRCYAQRSPAVARNYEEVRCGSVVRKNCQDVTAYAVGSLQTTSLVGVDHQHGLQDMQMLPHAPTP